MTDTDTQPTEQSFGQEGTLRAAGYKVLQLPKDPTPEDQPLSKEGAVQELKQRRLQESPPLQVKLNADPDVAIKSPEDAAELLKAARAADKDRLEAPQRDVDNALRDEIDSMRGQPTQADQAAANKAAADRAEAERQELLKAVATTYERNESTQAAYKLATAEEQTRMRGMAALATLGQQFPELSSLTNVQQIPQLIAALQQRGQGQRAQQLVNQLRGLDSISGEYNRITAAKAQHANSQFQSWSQQQDAAFRAKHASDKDYQTVAAGVVDVLKTYGITADEYASLASRPEGQFLRDSRVQSLLYGLSKQAIEGKAAAKARADALKNIPDVPPVQRPGTSAPRQPSGAARISQLNAKIGRATGDAALRAAADLLTARRNAR